MQTIDSLIEHLLNKSKIYKHYTPCCVMWKKFCPTLKNAIFEKKSIEHFWTSKQLNRIMHGATKSPAVWAQQRVFFKHLNKMKEELMHSQPTGFQGEYFWISFLFSLALFLDTGNIESIKTYHRFERVKLKIKLFVDWKLDSMIFWNTFVISTRLMNMVKVTLKRWYANINNIEANYSWKITTRTKTVVLTNGDKVINGFKT